MRFGVWVFARLAIGDLLCVEHCAWAVAHDRWHATLLVMFRLQRNTFFQLMLFWDVLIFTRLNGQEKLSVLFAPVWKQVTYKID